MSRPDFFTSLSFCLSITPPPLVNTLLSMRSVYPYALNARSLLVAMNAPSIMSATVLFTLRVAIVPNSKYSSDMVNTRLKRRSTLNMGMLTDLVPPSPHSTLSRKMTGKGITLPACVLLASGNVIHPKALAAHSSASVQVNWLSASTFQEGKFHRESTTLFTSMRAMLVPPYRQALKMRSARE